MSNLKFTAEQMGRYLELLRESGNKGAAAEACGVSTVTVRRLREADPAFDADCDLALEDFYDDLEAEAVRRARDGVDKPVFYKGDECGYVREYSDSLLMFLLKGRRRQVFGDKSEVELSGKNGGPIEMTDTERGKRVEELLRVAGERKALVDGLV